MFRLSLKTALLSLILLSGLFIPLSVLHAQGSPAQAESSWLDKAQEGGLNTVATDAYGQTGEPSKSLQGIVTTIIRFALGFIGLILIVMFIVSGFQYMTAGGNEETVKQAVSRIRNAIIGLIIILAAYSITYFVTNKVAPTITNGR